MRTVDDDFPRILTPQDSTLPEIRYDPRIVSHSIGGRHRRRWRDRLRAWLRR